MAIRIRKINKVWVALCAAETNSEPDDIYLDDNLHYALAAKFARDWQGQIINWSYPEADKLAATQKLRDAKEELEKWVRE